MWRAIKAVLWAFLGIRGREGYDQDRAKLSARQVITAGLFVAAMFVAGLFLLVRTITAH
jgi:hypothetical protein